ncbi:hypothetical protein MC885_004443 [Smutsia gigantea]|nr:hypothetical protein MC885_004443 [Smutsia gigantea]
MHVPSHTPQPHLSVPPAREASRAKPEPLLSLPLHTHLQTWKLRGQIFSFFFPPSFPPQTDPRAGAGEPDPRSAPAATGDAGRGAARERQPEPRPPALAPEARLGARALHPSHPQARRRRPRPTARGSALTLGLPQSTSHPPRRQKEGSARSLLGHRRGGSADPSAATPHTKGLPGPGLSVGALVPAPRAGTHPPAGMCKNNSDRQMYYPQSLLPNGSSYPNCNTCTHPVEGAGPLTDT